MISRPTWLNVTGIWFEADNLTAIIEWEANSDCLNFTISLLTSPIIIIDTSLDYNITTRSTSHTFIIFYNTNYTVTVAVALIVVGTIVIKSVKHLTSVPKTYTTTH